MGGTTNGRQRQAKVNCLEEVFNPHMNGIGVLGMGRVAGRAIIKVYLIQRYTEETRRMSVKCVTKSE